MGSALPSEIWEKFASGDISNYQKLFEGYYDGLYGYGLKICKDSGLVEDCIQELFEEGFAEPPLFRVLMVD